MKPLKPSKPEQHAMTAPSTSSETDTLSQLLAAAGNIETYRADFGMTKAALLRQYPELGTDRTYNKIISGDHSQLDLDKWSEAYAHVWRQIKDADSAGDDSLIPTLTGPVELCRSYLETRLTKGNDRFIMFLCRDIRRRWMQYGENRPYDLNTKKGYTKCNRCSNRAEEWDHIEPVGEIGDMVDVRLGQNDRMAHLHDLMDVVLNTKDIRDMRQ
mgnify:CR=1 FL=1